MGALNDDWPLGASGSVTVGALSFLNSDAAPSRLELEAKPDNAELDKVLHVLQWSGKLRRDIKQARPGEGAMILAPFDKVGVLANMTREEIWETYGQTIFWMEKYEDIPLTAVFSRARIPGLETPSLSVYPPPWGPLEIQADEEKGN